MILLLTLSQLSQLRSEYQETASESGALVPIVGIDAVDFVPFLQLAVKSLEKMDCSTVPILTQNSFLLLSCGFWLENDENDIVISFITTLLQKFPHLGISMAPVVLELMPCDVLLSMEMSSFEKFAFCVKPLSPMHSARKKFGMWLVSS